MDCSVVLRDVTHVVIKTGYAPSLENLFAMEAALKDGIDKDVEVLFAYSTIAGIGLVVPSPFGFVPSPFVLPTFVRRQDPDEEYRKCCDDYAKKIKVAISEIMERASSKPFYETTLGVVANKIRAAEKIYVEQRDTRYGPRIDLFVDLFEAVRDWSSEALNPDSPMAYDDYVACLASNSEIPYSACDFLEMDPEDAPLMSYAERLRESMEVIDALGGTSEIEGTLCLKVGEMAAARAFDIVEKLRSEDVRYCAFYGLAGFRFVETEERSILVLKYDASHG